MLFIIAMDVLNSLLSGLLHPISGLTGIAQRASFYADLVVLFLKPSMRDLKVVRDSQYPWRGLRLKN